MLKKQRFYVPYFYLSLILCCLSIHKSELQAATFSNLSDKNFSYIYVPGIICIETQAAKYIPEFEASSGEIITCNRGIHTINKPLSTCTFSDTTNRSLTNQSLNPFVYIGYWITDKLNKKYGVTVQQNQSSRSSYTVNEHSFDLTQLNLAQDGDIESLFKAYTEHVQKYPDSHIVLYGASRGAATICTFMAKHQPQNIAAIVLEAPFDSVPHLLRHSRKTTHKQIRTLLPKISAYNPNGASPITSVENISKEIPVLIIASTVDDVIPVECAKRLKRKFAKVGHHKAHLLVLNKCTHSGYAYDDQTDRAKYESVVHAFYKHYGLPYDIDLASLGTEEWKKISGEQNMMPLQN